MIFVGVDWAEDHHDICVMDQAGEVLGKRRIADSVEGLAQLLNWSVASEETKRWSSASRSTAA